MLIERISREHIVACTGNVDIHVSATAGVIAVLLRKTRGGTVLPEHIDAIDLEMQRRRSRPHKAAHATIPDRLAFLRSRGGFVVVQIGAGDQGAVINS